EFRIEGAGTNLDFLRNLLDLPAVAANDVNTTFVEAHMAELAAPRRSPAPFPAPAAAAHAPANGRPGLAGIKVDARDPLAVLDYGKTGAAAAPAADTAASPVPTPAPQHGPEGTTAVVAPLQGTIVEINVTEGDLVAQ